MRYLLDHLGELGSVADQTLEQLGMLTGGWMGAGGGGRLASLPTPPPAWLRWSGGCLVAAGHARRCLPALPACLACLCKGGRALAGRGTRALLLAAAPALSGGGEAAV